MHKYLMLLLVSVLLPCSLYAQPLTIEQQRDIFLKAEKLVADPTSKRAKALWAKLVGYPLLPYLNQAALMRNPYLANQPQIDQFLQEYAGTTLDRPLRKKWLQYLAKKKEDELFLQYYQDIGSTELACTKLRIEQQRAPQNESILAQVDALWLTGESLPKECDPILANWKKAGRLTDELVWQRLTLAADGGNHTLIPYLKKLLPKDQRYLADLWYEVRRSPSKVSIKSKFKGQFAHKEAQIVTYALKRLIWHDRELALKSWYTLSDHIPFSVAQKDQIAERFAIALTLENHDQAGKWLETANKRFDNESIIHWHLAHLLRKQDWAGLVSLTQAAAENGHQDNASEYWQARSYELLSATDQAQKGYQQLAEKRHYYGFLASGRIKAQPSLADAPLQYDAEELANIARLPAAQRAHELLQLDRDIEARREWFNMLDTLNEQQRTVAAVLADSWGWYDQAILTFSKVGYLDDVRRRFPLAYRQELTSSAQANQVDPAWAFAIARRESSFMSDAYSNVGARGLMQLMPGTARYLAKKRIPLQELYNPEVNVRYGTQYMRYLMDKMENNQILATAAYNAGWRRVRNWLPEDKPVDADIWVETIPYKETRNYVKAVMAYKQIYLHLLGQPQNLFSELTEMTIPAAD